MEGKVTVRCKQCLNLPFKLEVPFVGFFSSIFLRLVSGMVQSYKLFLTFQTGGKWAEGSWIPPTGSVTAKECMAASTAAIHTSDLSFSTFVLQGQDAVESISIENLEKLLEKLASGTLGQWYKGWQLPAADVPAEIKQSLESVYKEFKEKNSIEVLSACDINSNLFRAFLLAGNEHPAKVEGYMHFFSKEKPKAAVTYQWSVGLSKDGHGVLSKLTELGDPSLLIWIDVFFIDQLSKNISMDLAMAQALYAQADFHVAIATPTLLERGWCLFEFVLRHHSGKKTKILGELHDKVGLELLYIVKHDVFKALSFFDCFQGDFDYFGNMTLFDARDKEAIYWSLNAIYDYSDPKINEAIIAQAFGRIVEPSHPPASLEQVSLEQVSLEQGVDRTGCCSRCSVQ